MCKKKQIKYCQTEIDECLRDKIKALNKEGKKTYACCCGHGKYPMTIVMQDKAGLFYDLISGAIILRRRKFYKKDKDGYYYIPETVEMEKKK